jgi:hypothetical protein
VLCAVSVSTEAKVSVLESSLSMAMMFARRACVYVESQVDRALNETVISSSVSVMGCNATP